MKLQTAQEIYDGMFRKRIPHGRLESFQWRSLRSLRPQKPMAFIQEKLDAGCVVKAGYMTTAVRGYREYIVLWKEPGKKSLPSTE